jgi:hypothetical protein
MSMHSMQNVSVYPRITLVAIVISKGDELEIATLLPV